MNVEITLLILRLAAGGCLLLFVGTIGYMLWRDLQQAAVLVSATKPSGRLIVVESHTPEIKVGQSFPLALPTLLGRAADTLVLPDEMAAERIAMILWNEGRWWLQDLNGGSSVLLNSHPIQSPALLSAGDVISCGQVQLLLELD